MAPQAFAKGAPAPLPYAYAPLLSSGDEKQDQSRRGGVRYCRACVAVSVALVLVAGAVTGARVGLAGVDEDADAFAWSNSMLQWQRAGFHFQTEKNFMSGIDLIS